jgi:hypothetical protein
VPLTDGTTSSIINESKIPWPAAKQMPNPECFPKPSRKLREEDPVLEKRLDSSASALQ